MDSYKKIHLLSQELIPVIKDLDHEPKHILLEHMEECADCKNLYLKTTNFDENITEPDFSDDVELKPLKKLAQFNAGLKLLLISVRVIILFYIFYTSFRFFEAELSATIMLEYFRSGILLFYTPAAIFLHVFTFTFFNKKWVWISLIIDLVIILFLDNMVQLFL